MILAQAKFEALLRQLREKEHTELPTTEGKQYLHLDKEGDRAYFIRHVAALANNVEPSYLIIGVENRTWNPIGLPEGSPLHNSDETQGRMNRILANRLDPNLSVRYRTYEVSGRVFGLVAIEGRQAPYIVAIEDQKYGGDRTRARPSYIYRGAIYVRHGANSIIANRQSEVLGIVDRTQELTAGDDQPDEFLTTSNYIDVDAENFGHHALSTGLVSLRLQRDDPSLNPSPTESWVSFVFCPNDSGCQVDTVELKNGLRPDQRIGRGPEWYRGIPKTLIHMLYDPQATPREFIGADRWRSESQNENEDKQITHFIRIKPSGHIEVACSHPLYIKHDDRGYFLFVPLVGYLWQMTYLAQAIYQSCGYSGTVSIFVNLIGTKGTSLTEYAKSERGGWASPFNWEYTPSPQGVYQHPNIQIEKKLALADSSDDEIEAIVRKIAKDLGAYYGQDRPRCFDYHTEEFPVRQYRI